MMYVTSHDAFLELLISLQRDYRVVVPVRTPSGYQFRRFDGSEPRFTPGEVRTSEPVKSFLFPPRKLVAQDFSPDLPEEAPESKPYCVAGVKACDVRGFRFLDAVFRDREIADPFYTQARAETLIISADCTGALDTCFCKAFGQPPYPNKGFDLNLSPIESGYVLEAGSPRGEELIAHHPALFHEADSEAIAERDRQRERVTELVEQNVKANGIPDSEALAGGIARHFDDPIWQEEAARCVECGACNTICPTCHCFLLCDRSNGGENQRYRLWDSCMLKDFARVAGGGNPRPYLGMRLRNRFEKKFDYAWTQHGMFSCTGCGRCIRACPARIDIREVMKRMANRGDRVESVSSH